MYMKFGKVIFGYKDTFNLDNTLNPVIYAGLIKFKEVLQERNKNGKVHGVPFIREDQDIEEASKEWFEIIDKMIYAFNIKAEPDISKYSMKLELTDKGIDIGNREEYDRYNKDSEEHEEKVKEGLKLFAEYYSSLWW